jgi:hypothetical protein
MRGAKVASFGVSLVVALTGQATAQDNDCAQKLTANPPVKDIIACLKQLERAAVPVGTIAFFDSEQCRSGWAPVSKLVGRYVVGAPEDSPNIGQAVGQVLTPNENRATGGHSHQYKWQETTGSDRRVAGAGPVAAGSSYDRYEVTGTTTAPLGPDVKPGTPAPYVQLLACRKE